MQYRNGQRLPLEGLTARLSVNPRARRLSIRIDARLSPTVTNQLAEAKPFTWFKSNMIHTVPWPYPGFGRDRKSVV